MNKKSLKELKILLENKIARNNESLERLECDRLNSTIKPMIDIMTAENDLMYDIIKYTINGEKALLKI